MDEIAERLDKLEYHQQLLVRMLKDTELPLYYLIVEHDLSKEDTEQVLNICEELSKKFKKQKAEGYVTFYPLLFELQKKIPASISSLELIHACIKQGVHTEFMKEMKSVLQEGD
ncbi:DUF1878 family protein [Bacillus sp. 1P06AnD]|uniref:DUF1878 family protein n=1 Tax=Bacillus sp. 1P06AnD TaxID=3132208 RepID=UPI0039A1308C